MKKVLAVVLAMIIALSCAVMAFAEGETYKCSFCGQSCKDYEALCIHEDKCVNNPNTATTTFECQFCGQKLADYVPLCTHQETCKKNPNSPNFVSDSEYWGKCPFCGDAFESATDYTDHIQHCRSNDDAHIDFDDGAEVITGKFSFAKIIDEIQEFFNISVDNHNTSLITSIESIILGFFEFILGLGDLGLGYIDAGVIPVA